jgi:iron complex outermembrane receptor protein/outer membrane receptor for ferrienterochelin and colicins
LQQGASVGWQATQTYEADTWSFGVEDEFQVLENLTLVAGLSYDLYDPREAYNQPVPGSADAVNPQGGLVYRPTDTTTLHASVGRKTRFPHLKELYSQVSGGNPDLDPQETIAYEVGVEQRLSESLTGSVTGFYNDIDDLIQQVTLAGSKVYVNVGKAVTQGIETSLSWAATDALTCSTNYTYLDTLDRDNDRPLEYRPAHRLNGSVDYKFPFGLDFRLQTSYTDRQFQYPSATTKRRIPEFLLLDAKLTYKVGRKDIKGNFGISPEFFVQVTNFTDKDYEEGHPMPGREFLAGFALEF